MRRGGCGYRLQVPWRQHDDPIPSSTPFEQLEGQKFRFVIALVGFSTAILIFVWNSGQVVFRSDLPPRTSTGLVFPLYSHNYIHSPNGSQNEMWHQGNGANGRRRRTLSHPLFKLKFETKLGRESFYIEMKLGIQAKLFNFDIDTGSCNTWVYCKRLGHKSYIKKLGPHGYFKPKNMEPIKCNGKDKRLCHMHQYHHGRDRPCNARHNFECLAWIEYADGSTYKGTYYWESFTLPTWNKIQVKGQGVLGCITQDTYEKQMPSFAYDGTIGLGVCKNTIISDWMKSKLITNRRIGICIGQAKSRQLLSSRIDVGYVTIGVNLQEKFGVDHFGWAMVAITEGYDCAIYTKISYIIFEGKAHYPPTSDLRLALDTGAELTHLGSWFFDEFSRELDSHAIEKGYTETESDLNFQYKDRRKCWIASKDTTTSPLDNFPTITFCMASFPDLINLDPIQCLVVQPRNYLEWKEDELLLCSNIINANPEVIDEEDYFQTSGSTYDDAKYKILDGESILGRAQMRDYLFEVDPDNYRVRWQPDNCDFDN